MNNEEETGSPVFSTLLHMMNETVLREEIFFIATNFQILTSAITALELKVAAAHLESGIEKIQCEPYKSKLQTVINKNPDLKKLPNLADIIRGKAQNESLINPLQAIIYKKCAYRLCGN